MKKVLFIIDKLGVGGVESVLVSILNNFHYPEYKIELLVDTKSDLDDHIRSDLNIRVNYTNFETYSSNRFLRYLKSIIKELFPFKAKSIIKRGNYDIVIDFKGVDLSYIRKQKCITVFWNHKDFSVNTNPYERRFVEEYCKSPMGKAKSYFLNKSIQDVDYIVCVSKTMSEHFVERFGFQDKVRYIYNAIDTESIIQKSLENVCDVPEKTRFTFCCVSRVTEGKGLERLLYSSKRLNENGYLFNLIIVGDGDKFDELNLLKEALNLNNVYFLGKRMNPFPYYKYADAIVMPSENEACTVVIPESLVLKKAIVATNVGSAKEMLGESEYGLVVSSSEEGVYSGMKTFLDTPDLVNHYADSNCNSINRFNIESTMNSIKVFFDEIS